MSASSDCTCNTNANSTNSANSRDNNNNNNSKDAFPFDVTIISFPDEAAAHVAHKQLSSLSSPYGTILCTCDPLQCRVGSGGGTCHCLSLLLDDNDDDNTKQTTTTTRTTTTTLILHAGGNASRTPTQLLLGKAWTSVIAAAASSSSSSDTTTIVSNPVRLWLELTRTLFVGLPRGSTVIVASDTLLDLGGHWNGNNFASLETINAVIGLAVPAPLHTACNHGVFCSNNQPGIQTVTNVLQKPSMAELQQTQQHQCLNGNNNNNNDNNNDTATAWIDTGVTILTPLATQTFLTLTRTVLSACTESGLRQLYHKQQQHTVSLLEFAQQHALNVDLYTHLFQACQWSSNNTNTNEPQQQQQQKEAYQHRHAHTLPHSIADALWDTLHNNNNNNNPTLLQVLNVPHGTFWHLGTSTELRDFLVDCPLRSPLQRMHCLRDAYWTGNVHLQNDQKTVMMNCLFVLPKEEEMSDGSSVWNIGERTVLEHCAVVGRGTLTVGTNCLLSSLRHCINIHLPNNFMALMVPTKTKQTFIVVVLGMDDPIKQCTTVYGRSWSDFFQQSGVTDGDVWDDATTNKSLWTAKLHPVVNCSDDNKLSFSSLFGWIESFAGMSITDDDSLVRWTTSQRVSLSELGHLGDATAEFEYRQSHTARIVAHKAGRNQALVTSLTQRENIQYCPLDWHCLFCCYADSRDGADLVATFHALDALIEQTTMLVNPEEEVNQEGVTGRALLLMKAILDEICAILSNQQPSSKPPHLYGSSLSDLLPSDVDPRNTLQLFGQLARIRDDALQEQNIEQLGVLCNAIGDLARLYVARKVCAARGMAATLVHRSPVVYGEWIVASAPVRIDLSGGWTDTPPICYEYGSTVTGVAVTIDGRKPLACRCRVIKGGMGILLRTESRQLQNGNLESSVEAEIGCFSDLQDYKEPISDCALLKCVLVHLGLACDTTAAFQDAVNRFCGGTEPVRLEIVSTSLLPHGSGLGTSSILAGCILAALGETLSAGSHKKEHYERDLIDSVSNVEQLLTSGGGHQDQVNGLIGGFKTVTSDPESHPMKLSIEQHSVDGEFCHAFEENVVLVFTGKTRLAKNLLTSVLNRWAKRTPEILQTVSDLVETAQKTRESIVNADLDELGTCLSSYWKQKKIMAGEASGVEPMFVENFLEALASKGMIRGASMCGAGGGGFMALLKADDVSRADLVEESLEGFTWHSCQIDHCGIALQQTGDVAPHQFDIALLDTN